MKLKSVEISGFKSFREKVALKFSAGVTAIVGPNGCGKSNVVDAIRWVLGEQRAKALRGKSMEDVIFNGSADSPPVGFSEVSMLLEASDKPFAGIYADLPEMVIARKLYRDGESEYTINNAPCRLLDIREFFMGTGVGAKAYSIIEQNSVALLVEAKPEERRHYIEEAAGISKYKSRKESSLRKMEATEQNLQRLQDVIHEVKNQMKAVSRQAKRAEQFKELRKDIREGEILLALQNDFVLAETRKVKEKEKDVLGREETAVQTDYARIQSALEATRLNIAEKNEFLSEAQENYFRLKNDVSAKEQEISFLNNKIGTLGEVLEKGGSELETLMLKLRELSAEKTMVEGSLVQGKAMIAALEERLQNQLAQKDEFREKSHVLQEAVETRKKACYEILSETTKLKGMIFPLEKGLEDIQRREVRAKRENEELEGRLAGLDTTLEGLRREITAGEERHAGLLAKKEEILDELERHKQELADLGENLIALTEAFNQKKARLTSLRELQSAYIGYSKAAKTIMTAKHGEQDTNLPYDRFLGLLVDHIDVSHGYEAAVEAVLGDTLQYIMVRSREDGLQAIEYLKAGQLGRGSFMPLELRHDRQDVPLHFPEGEPLLNKIRVKEEFVDLARFLFGGVLVIPDLTHGIRLWENGFAGILVTKDGDVIHPQGILTGGRGEEGEELSLLKNKREAVILEEDAADLSAQLEEEKENKDQLRRRVQALEEELDVFRGDIHQAAFQIQGRKKDEERFRADRDRIVQRIRVVGFNLDQCLNERSRGEADLEKARKRLFEEEQREKSLQEELILLQEQWDKLQKEFEGREEVLTKDRIALATLQEKTEGQVLSLARMERESHSLAETIEGKKTAIDKARTEGLQAEKAVKESHEKLSLLCRERDEGEKILNSKQEILKQDSETLLVQEEQENKIIKQLQELERARRDFDFELQEVALKREQLHQVFADKYQINLDDMGTPFQPLTDEAMLRIEEQLVKDRNTFETFGAVNLLALDEYEEVKERHEFLLRQTEDLTTSLESLKKTIAHINQISKRRFLETFNGVNDCFRLIFSRIFQGGRGELILCDSQDLLETGVDIQLQIPGKKTQNISLLSGGEKTLAAVALIFALFMYRPSPFLIMDEVDAALDDANVSLFNRLVRDMAAQSQIIMVTHNKSTMEVADCLFGVTMQKRGISSLVSVNLN
ncbi:MAG: chromosome segregation protein SMC [Syntrophobacterales bacterium]|jgi:chromosome segregation protein|nr:chromosome segregation protein SMC [Syntrophobacterales bacterium]